MPLGRLAVTLLAVLCVLGLGRVPLPGLPPDLPTPGGAVLTTTSVAALGIMPFLTASILVEIATLIVPGWRKRAAAAAEATSGEHFERRRRRTALRLGIVLAAKSAQAR
jgi:preprotein translocase subunit SecY